MTIPQRRIILAGGSGLLGQHLATHFKMAGWDVVVLSRRNNRNGSPARTVQWDGKTSGPWISELEGATALVNLTGKNVNCRYTPENRREIMESRVDSVRVLGQSLARLNCPPPVWLQASSLAIYGDAGDRVCDEEMPHGNGFGAEVCRAWEAEFAAASPPSIRGVVLRIGFVLAREGGALVPLERLTRCFLGGTIGDGRQWISWIHVLDTIRSIGFLIDRTDQAGIFNLTGPEPVTNRALMRQMRETIGRPWSPPAPRWALHLGAWAMRSEPELALTGRRCIPHRLQAAGFHFVHQHLPGALSSLYAP